MPNDVQNTENEKLVKRIEKNKFIEKLKNKEIKKCHKILIIIGIVFILLPVFNKNLWFDEAYSVGLANQTFVNIWKIGSNDVHPVLYYFMLRCVNLLTSGSIVAYKVFSSIPIIIMIILGYTHIRKDFGEKTGFIFSFLSIFLPEMLVYAAEVRMYSWAILTITILSIYAYRLSKKDDVKNWIIFFLASITSIYLHYYGLMAAGLINVVLLVYLFKNKRRRGLITILIFGFIQLLAYIPWMISLASQISFVSNSYWIEFEFPQTIMELLASQLAGNISLEIPTICAILLLIYVIYQVKKIHNKENLIPFYLSAGMYLAVIIAAMIITIVLGTSVLYYRYLFVITGLYIFALSYLLSKETNKKIVSLILIVIMILGIYNNVIMISDNYSSTNQEPINYLRENIQEGDTIVYTDCGVGSIIAVQFLDNQIYYYNEEDWGIEEAYKAFEPNYETCITTEFLEKCSNRVWVIDNAFGSAYEELFEDNDEYEKISEKKFYTKYHEYHWKITLIEKY